MNIDWLINKMDSVRNQIAFICNDKSLLYSDIVTCYDLWKNKLKELHIEPNTIVAVIGDYGEDILGLLLALIENNNIIIPLSDLLEAKINELLDITGFDYVYKECDGFQHASDQSSHPDYALIEQLREADVPGLILFTSGSTGVPKAVLHDFEKLLGKYRKEGIRLVTLTFLLMDHIGGINTLFYTISNGGTAVTTISRSVKDICQTIGKNGVELLPATPSFFNLLIQSRMYEKFDLSSLKLITYGTEVMPDSTLKKLNEIFPFVKIKQTYGLSELGILKTISESSDSTWFKIKDDAYEIKIVDNYLYIKTDSGMLGYLNSESPYDEDGWYNTYDQVEVKGDYFKVLGRQSEIINVGGQKVYPAEVENLLYQMPNILDVSVKGEKNKFLGNIVIAIVNLNEPETEEEMMKELEDFCRDKIEKYKIPLKVIIKDEPLYNIRFKKLRK